MPNWHVELVKRVIVKETKPKLVGFRKTMHWPGYSGWECVAVYQHEIDNLRKRWSIPYGLIGEDVIFVYDDDIIKKVHKQDKENEQFKIKQKINKSNKKKKNYVKKRNR
jgi:hypothetical protein